MPIAYATTKLTEDDVREIRKLSHWGWTREEILREFPQVSRQTIADILSRKTWKHVI